jgi:hypothetical protein
MLKPELSQYASVNDGGIDGSPKMVYKGLLALVRLSNVIWAYARIMG